MTELIPPIINNENISSAEIKTFYMFQEMDMECIVLHSLGLANHIEKVFGEIDFLLISRDGVLCLEVKGGGLVRENGVYYHIYRNGERHKSLESPFQQVLKNMYSLRGYIKNIFSQESPYYKCQFACGLIFPDMKFNIKDPEIIPDIVFDNTYENVELKDFIKKVFSYWKNKTKKSLGFECCQLSSSEIKILGKRLRGDFSCIPSLGYITDEIDRQLIKLTEQQYNSLKMISENKKILIKGFAGTGKTVLAFEHAKRKALEGNRVLYLCFNKLLSTFLLQNLNTDIYLENSNLVIDNFHGYLNKYLNINNIEDINQANFFEDIMPDKFLDYINENPIENKFDIMIIDEGQDLLRINYVMCLNELLSGGFAEGNWCVFLTKIYIIKIS